MNINFYGVCKSVYCRIESYFRISSPCFLRCFAGIIQVLEWVISCVVSILAPLRAKSVSGKRNVCKAKQKKHCDYYKNYFFHFLAPSRNRQWRKWGGAGCFRGIWVFRHI